MKAVYRREILTILIAGCVFIAISIYSISYARTAVRDDLRKQDLTNIKHALEQYYNVHEFYPNESTRKTHCTSSGPESWFFGEHSPLLQEQFIDAIPHDVRESNGFTYTYCVTSVPEGEYTNRASGFFIEAQLESDAPDGTFFDEDEERKFHYRVVLKKGKTLYRICGGEEDQCTNQNL